MPLSGSGVGAPPLFWTAMSHQRAVVLGGAGGADDVRAPGLGDLDGEVTDAAGGRVNEDPLPGADVGRVDESW